MSLPLKDDARAALERYLADDLALEETPDAYRAVREVFASIGVYSAGVDFAQWLLVADTRVRSLPPLVDPRDAVVRAAVVWHEAREAYMAARLGDEYAEYAAYDDAWLALRTAVAAYRAGEGR